MVLPAVRERFSSAVSEAVSALRARDLQEIASRSGSRLERGRIVTKVLDREMVIDAEHGEMAWSDGSAPDSDIKVLVLHYLLGVKGPPGAGWRSFREFEGGALYYSVFHSRALVPLISRFGADPAVLRAAALRLGGVEVSRGDASFDFWFFPNLLVNVTLWAGDSEVPASANILFDPSVGEYMGAEDLAHISEGLVEMLIRAAE